MTMASHWPPSPHVEDEESALKNEVTHKVEVNNKNQAEEARFRGSVDQCPIILDMNPELASKRDYTSSTDNESARGQSSDDSCGPPTPPISKAGRKQPQIPPVPPNSRSWSERVTPASKILKQPKDNVNPRGRQETPRIQTDLHGDLQGMISGRRRAPSPYSFIKPDAHPKNDASKRFSGNTLLSPEHLAPIQSFSAAENNQRPSSAQPRSGPRSRNDSDDSTDSESKRRHDFRQQARRETFSHAPPSTDEEPSMLPEGRQSSIYHMIPRSAKDGRSRKDSDKEASDRVYGNDRHHKRHSKETPHTSPAEDSLFARRFDFVSRSDKRASRESSHISSAEEERKARRDPMRSNESEGQRSHRESISRKERPHLDLSGHHHSYHGASTEERRGSGRNGRQGNPIFDGRSYLEPSSFRSPKAMEDYLQTALREKSDRSHKESPRSSPSASPRNSPPGTPPRTPHVDRRSRDYFSLNMPTSAQSSDAIRPRAPSHGESYHNYVKPMASVLAATAAAKAVPSLSRNSTSSTEMHSGANSSRLANGRRSRNTSPIRDSTATFLRAGSNHERSGTQVMRDGELPNSLPMSRSGSASYQLPATASSDRSNTRNGSYVPPPVEIPRLNPRAFSYSTADESRNPRQPSSAKPAQLHFAPPPGPNSAPLPTTPRLPRSPSLTEKTNLYYPLPELPPCPRSAPEAGHYDWYMIVDMPQLDICPSCMTVLGASRFRDQFVPSTTMIPGQQTLCDFSRPWIWKAWSQIIKQRRNSLDMIREIVHNSETTRPCPGKGSDVRAWYRLPDPKTGNHVPNFDACSECVRSVEIIFPQLRGIFKRSGALVQERTCDLNTQSKRFTVYLNLLDAVALRYDVEHLREPNIQAFADYARRTSRVRECTRDDMVMGQLWHFIPGLPEFTICEDCFDQVVWPIVDQPIASSVNRSLQLVPSSTHRGMGISCQLYSERMRKMFLEAVKYADFDFLRQAALRRHGVERQLQDKHKMYMNDMAMGMDRTAELQANIKEWRNWE
jgi:hypothetical protein